MGNKEIGRIRIVIEPEGRRDRTYSYGANFYYRTGWSDACETQSFNLSISELRDIQYMIGELLRGVE